MTGLSDAQFDLPAGAPGILSVMERDEQVSNVMNILRALPANQQEVIRLKFQGDLSYQQISEITKLSVSNVGFLIHTGIKTIREKSQSGQTQRRAK